MRVQIWGWYSENRRIEFLFLACITIFGAVVRLRGIDGRPIHYDEGVHAYYAWKFLESGIYHYNPGRHGPLIYYVSIFGFSLVDTSVVVGRTVIALISTMIVPLAYLIVRRSSAMSASISALILAIHPFVLNASRFYRSDALLATFLLLSIYLYLYGLDSRHQRIFVFLGVSISLTIASKELGYVLLSILVLPILLLVHFQARFSSEDIIHSSLNYLPINQGRWVLLGLVLPLVVLYAGWPPDLFHIPWSFAAGIYYWMIFGQESSAEALFYILPLLKRAPIVFGLSLIGCAGTLTRIRQPWYRWIFVFWAALGGMFLSMLGHQWSWLILHVFIPVAILSGFGAQDINDFLQAYWEWPSGKDAVTVAIIILLVLSTVGLGGPRDIPQKFGTGFSNHDQHREEAYAEARTVSEQTNCPILLLGERAKLGYKWPAKWLLHGYEWTYMEARHLDNQSTSVILSTHEMELNSVTNATEAGPFRIYPPKSHCYPNTT